MSKTFIVAFGIGLAVIALAVAGVLYMNRGAHLALPGKMLKIRTLPIDDHNSLAIADFEITNTSDYALEVRTVSLILEDPDGSRHSGLVSSDVDAKRIFDGYPVLGPKYSPSLITMEKIPPRTTEDRMVAAEFSMPESTLAARKRFVVRIEEIDGKIFEVSEK